MNQPSLAIKKLWEIKGERTFAEMAGKIEGLTPEGLMLIMRAKRGGRLDTWQKIMQAYPEIVPLVIGASETTPTPPPSFKGGLRCTVSVKEIQMKLHQVTRYAKPNTTTAHGVARSKTHCLSLHN